MVIVFPLLLTIAFGASFGAIGGGESRYSIAVINEDAGPAGVAFTSVLSHIEVLSIQNYTDPSAAQSNLKQGNLKAVITIPPGLHREYPVLQPEPYTTIRVAQHDPRYVDRPGSMVASAAIPSIIGQTICVDADHE
jgi:hypothetical protein